MKTATVREFRGQVSSLLDGEDAVLVTRRGKPAGILYPFTNPDKIPPAVRRELFLKMSSRIADQLKTRGIDEDELLRDFDRHRKRRRGQ